MKMEMKLKCKFKYSEFYTWQRLQLKSNLQIIKLKYKIMYLNSTQ